MNRADRAKEYFLNNLGRHISKKELAEAGISDFYVVRNAVAEAKSLLGDGYDIIPENKDAGTCGYRCVKISGGGLNNGNASKGNGVLPSPVNVTGSALQPIVAAPPPPVIYFDTKKKTQRIFAFGDLS